ncbi:MAG TPA: hypothetical protein VJZ73_13225 [Methylomirabilota bacterium]|nr:hypothetical protein [Methylomirabilota bacterium]
MGTAFSYPFSSPFEGSGFSFVPPPTRAQQLGQNNNPNIGRDRMLDPFTGDYIRTANGEWAETSDSRTIMLISLSVRLGESPFDPSHGTSIHRRLKSGIVLSTDFLQAETVRVGEDLRQEGVLSDLVVTVRDQDGNKLRDETGRLIIRTQWRDLASGSPIDATFTPR